MRIGTDEPSWGSAQTLAGGFAERETRFTPSHPRFPGDQGFRAEIRPVRGHATAPGRGVPGRWSIGCGRPDQAAVAWSLSGRNRRSRWLLVTTNTLDSAIAAPASIGLSRPSAARGRAAEL